MELRPFADGAVDLVGQLRRLQGIDVGLHGYREHVLGPRHRAQDRLAADDDKFVLVGDVTAGTNDVLQFFPRHGCSSDTFPLSPPISIPFLSSSTCCRMVCRAWGDRIVTKGDA